MTQPTPSPTPDLPPPPPALPEPQVPTVTLPGGASIPLEGVPRNAQEVQGLRERREILRDQLERATNRREGLLQELSGDEGGRPLGAEARAGIQQRLTLLDERILQIERDQALTERQLSSAPPGVLAQTIAEPREVPGMVDEDDAIASGFAAFFAGIVLTIVVSRVRRRFARRRAGHASPQAVARADDPNMERLTHAVNAIAEEVERIGEGQRFVTQLLASRKAEPVLRGDPDGR